MQDQIYTIGHSTHSLEHFISLLKKAGITAIADVRSIPFSRHMPHFNKQELKVVLKDIGIEYSFLGNQLGARPEDQSCYVNGKADFRKIASKQWFKEGLSRVLKGSAKYNIALMCAEKDPLDCHRNILVAKNLQDNGATIFHILDDGTIENNKATEQRLRISVNRTTEDMFEKLEDDYNALDNAYYLRGIDIAFTEAKQESGNEADDNRLYANNS